MTTYSIRCRHDACRHRRVSRTHPDDYKRPPKCPKCGSTKGWRIEGREYNRRGLCDCNGPEACKGQYFPHRNTHPLCDNNPMGPINQARYRGVPEAYALGIFGRGPLSKDKDITTHERGHGLLEISLEGMAGRPMGVDEPCPF